MLQITFNFIVSLGLTALTLYVIPYLKEKKLYDAVAIAVRAAEQIYRETGMGKAKFAHVKEWIQKKFKISDEDLKNIIESAVYELNGDKKK